MAAREEEVQELHRKDTCSLWRLVRVDHFSWCETRFCEDQGCRMSCPRVVSHAFPTAHALNFVLDLSDSFFDTTTNV